MSNTEEEMDKPVTKRALNEAVAKLATRAELEAWVGALSAKIDATGARFERDMAQHANAIIRTLRDEVAKQIAAATDTFIGEAARIAGTIDEKYKHVTVDEWKAMAGRVHRLEAAVFPPPKRRRRRAS